MPDMMTPEEIQAEIAAVHAAHKRLGFMTQGMIDALKDAEVGIRGYTEAQRLKEEKLKADLLKLGTSLGGFVTGLAEGKTGQSAYNSAIQGSSDAIGSMAASLGPLGVAFSVILKVLTFGITKATNMADGLYKANQDLSKVGTIGAGGMTEVFTRMQKFGYGIDQIGEMTDLMTKNSQILAQFGRSAETGARRFADVAGMIQHSDLQRQFMNMGMSVDDINTGIAGYISLQTSLGTSQKLSTAELRTGAADYLMNMSRLSKLTGENADDLQRQRDKLMATDSFLATISEDAEKGPNGRKKVDDAFKVIQTIMSRSETVGIAIAQMYSGTLSGGDEINKALNAVGTALPDLVNQWKNGTISNDQFVIAVQEATKANLDNVRSFQKGGTLKGYLPSMAETLRLSGTDFAKSLKNAEDATSGQASGADALTNEHTKMLQAQIEARDAFQNLTFKAIPLVTERFNDLNDLLGKVLSWFGVENSYSPGGSASSIKEGNTYKAEIKNTAGEVVETRTGGDRNWRNNNPGNISYGKFAKEHGAIGTDGRFAIFPTMEAGEKAQDALLKSDKSIGGVSQNYKSMTMKEAIATWAPPNENDTANYQKMLANAGIDINKKYVDLSPDQQAKFRQAMNQMEGGHAGTITKGPGGSDTTAPKENTASNSTPAAPTNNYQSVTPSTENASNTLPEKPNKDNTPTSNSKAGKNEMSDVIAQQMQINDILRQQSRYNKAIADNTNPN
jgi:hypothetical protein